MSDQTANASIQASSATAAPAAKAPQPLWWSVRRELWENSAVYFAPLVVAGLALFGYAISSRHLTQDLESLRREAPQLGEIRSGDDDRQVGRRARHRLGDVVDDRLGEAEEAAGNGRLEALRQLVDQIRLRLAARPRVVRRQRDEQLIAVRSIRVRPIIVPARLRRDLSYFRRLLDQPANLARQVGRFGE